MKTKRFVTLILVVIMSIGLASNAAWAGSARTHRLEGAIIGIGALMLTQAIIDHHTVHSGNPYMEPPRPVIPSNHHRPLHRSAGYWKIQKTWVSGQYQKVWNAGHYNRRGVWVRGHWKKIETKPGYWTQERVWVPYR